MVLMHGIHDTNASLSHIEAVLQKTYPGIYVKSVEIGDGKLNSIDWPMNRQVDSFCRQLKADVNLKGGINLLGVSQGGLVTRGYLEKCNDPPVINYVSWVAPQMGTFGVPGLPLPRYEWVNELTGDQLYFPLLQRILSFSNYWKDPFRYQKYLHDATYLPDLNNERAIKNQTYKNNILNLKHFFLLYSQVDTTLVPKETGWFGYYANNTVKEVLPMESFDFYKEDWIGMRTLNETGRLTKIATTCDHADYRKSCFDKYFNMILPYLK